MTGLGIIGTAAALANYRSAKANLDALKERQDGLLAAVKSYNYSKYENVADSVNVNEVDFMQGVMVSTIVRVGNLVGKFFRAQVSIVLSNTSSNTYHISYVGADCKVLGYSLVVAKFGDSVAVKQEKTVDIELKPDETIEIKLPSGISALYNAQEENENYKLRDAICKAAGKSLITSCQKINIENAVNSDIMIKWSDGGETKTMVTRNRAGVLRYMMEAFYPND